jgi:ABC-type transport system involved in multi-copper enzyme maturation permease subunit
MNELHVMPALMRKDWRLLKPIVFAGLFFFVVPYVFLAYKFVVRGPWDVLGPEYADYMRAGMKVEYTQAAALIAGALWCVVLPALGGVAFARERRDRSAEMLELMPVGRGLRVLSKCLVVFPIVLAPIVATILVFYAANQTMIYSYIQTWQFYVRDLQQVYISGLSLAFAAFGFGLLASAIVRSEVLAASLGFGAALLMLMLYLQAQYAAHEFGYQPYAWVELFKERRGTIYLPAGLGVVTAVAGIVIAVRRREV